MAETNGIAGGECYFNNGGGMTMGESRANGEILEIAEAIVNGVDCAKIYLFGSYAYGNPHKDSDYDFYVVLKDGSPLKPIIAMQTIHRILIRKNLRVSIDVLANYQSRFDDRAGLLSLERKVATEGVLLYEQ
ncbi:MAG: nucleotidyltransferase domain-containing protein [Planctomycetaceae bacterium]|nr:nucleotidyltransferase domain-containing protein [Planctomycetaceae bacterium]